MKVAHFCHMGVGTSGMYHTVAELVTAENKLGMDAGLIDTNNYAGGNVDDTSGNFIVSKDLSWADDADVYVLSSIIPDDYKRKGKPIVMILHGVPEDIFESELYQLDPANKMPFSTMLAYIKNPIFKAFVTLWKEHYYYYKEYVPNLYYVPAGCNLDFWKPEGKRYEFNASGSPNIMFCDSWRFYKHPYHILHGILLAKRQLPELRLHLYGMPEDQKEIWYALLINTGMQNLLGELDSHIPDLDDTYRGADMVITSMHIATRVVREAMACGTPVIAGGYEHTPYNFHPYKPSEMAEQIIRCWQDIQTDPEGVRRRTRETAVKYMDVMNTARGLKKIYEKVLEE